MRKADKVLVWLSGEIKSPPFSPEARIRAGYLLRRLQRGENLAMPDSRPMPSLGDRCHELRLRDGKQAWRIVYRIDSDAVVLLDVFKKKTGRTPKQVIDTCRKRLSRYEDSIG